MDPVEQFARIESYAAEAESRLKAQLEEAQAQLQASLKRADESEAKLRNATEKNAEHDQRLMRAEAKIAEIENATWKEFLILLGIGSVFTVAGVYLQRRFQWDIPWVLMAGVGLSVYGYKHKSLPTYGKYVMVGGGGGLAFGSVIFTFANAFPGWHKSP